MGLVGDQQVQLGVLLHFHAQLIEALDGSIAGEEVLRPGAEGDNLEVLHADDGPGHGDEVPDHLRALRRSAHGILGDVGLQVAHAQVIGAVEHAAVGVAPAVDEVAVALCGGNVHGGTVKLLAQQRLRRLGAEVAQEHHQRVDAVGPDILQRLHGVRFILHSDRALIEALAVGRHNILAALGGQRDGEAVPGHGDDAEFDFRNIHSSSLLFPFKADLRCRYFLPAAPLWRRPWPRRSPDGPAATCCRR